LNCGPSAPSISLRSAKHCKHSVGLRRFVEGGSYNWNTLSFSYEYFVLLSFSYHRRLECHLFSTDTRLNFFASSRLAMIALRALPRQYQSNVTRERRKLVRAWSIIRTQAACYKPPTQQYRARTKTMEESVLVRSLQRRALRDCGLPKKPIRSSSPPPTMVLVRSQPQGSPRAAPDGPSTRLFIRISRTPQRRSRVQKDGLAGNRTPDLIHAKDALYHWSNVS